ncbi:ras guanine-nucleotide exchange protein-like protein [Plenodomus tracheiphilus IPT5]|uniref:Ras guanine-nucleotide exchange protein-like protein n=1 Tax=Plenodomus tracheiphilus IPT5 TaxID=1408161 RepID=A0A6A7AVF7_9PLEO|nr:ras guanine-nucleotide exchange protein-like protein [Plenodomus tracheiphilus IPT5]
MSSNIHDHALDLDLMDKRSSAQVAPLNIQKSPNKSRIGIFGHTRQSSSRGARSSRSHSQSQISPPLTPTTSTAAAIRYQQPAQAQPVFHNYLRAFYHYTPSITVSSSTDESSITVAIKQGDVILVHSVHPNGWADGTLLASGARGWLPTNYCEPYDHPTIRNLLTALTHLWDLVRDGENGDLVAFTRQDYVRGMIAGIRFFLERTECLSRDSRLIVEHVGLRRMRKGLLGDLSTLVKTAKNLQETLLSNEAPVPVFEHMDDLVLKSFKLVTRAVRFLDIWATDAVSLSLFELGVTDTNRPMTPPADSAESAVEPPTTTRQQGDDSLSTNGSDSPVTQGPLPGHEDWYTATYQPPRNLNRLSVAFSLPSEPDSLQSPTIFSHPHKRISVTHRLSYTSKSPSAHQGSLASERLNTAQDLFLGNIGSFIGLHLQSRSSGELATITQQSVITCRSLLTVVEEVWERDSRRSQPLEQARDNMFERLTELVQATKDMFDIADADVGGDVVEPESGKQLVTAATSCVRAAGDCVAKARLVIERIGDFEFEQAGLGLSEEIYQQLSPATQGPEERPASPRPAEPGMETNKPLPAPPADEPKALPPLIISESKPLPDVPQPSPMEETTINLQPVPTTVIVESPTAVSFRSSRSSMPTLNALTAPVLPPTTASDMLDSPMSTTHESFVSSTKTNSVNVSVTDSSSNYHFSMRDGSGSVVSHTSTRATTPDHSPTKKESSQTLMSSFGSSSELRSMASEDIAAGEEHLLETTYVHELVYNKEGQISGGSLPALVEQLTTYESTPDAVFVTAFYLTFRLFTTPIELAQTLIDRFDYIGDSQSVGVPVRLRVYNVFKGWLESHWSGESDAAALGLILSFATGKLRTAMPAAGKRLAELTSKVTEVRAGAIVPRLVSSIGKTGISHSVFTSADNNVPSSTITKSQLNALRASKEGKTQCSILDFDPLELARQFTIIESRLFCAIQPEELLALEWTKKCDSKAHNVKAMSTLSTDLANLVADTILQLEDAKKRAVIIKQWVKVAGKCLELHNYDSLMAIICSLNSSMVMRLKRTWELVSAKTKLRLEELKAITDVGRNYAVLRQRLHNHVAPCIPFVGIYLTDLTFIDVGNGTTRQLPGESGRESVSVINFDKHMKTAKIIGQLQSFQVPYRLAAIPEMQDWMEAQIQRVRSSDQANVTSYYRRSLLLEPREPQHSTRGSPSIDNSAQSTFSAESRTTSKDKFDFLNFNFSTHNLRN